MRRHRKPPQQLGLLADAYRAGYASYNLGSPLDEPGFVACVIGLKDGMSQASNLIANTPMHQQGDLGDFSGSFLGGLNDAYNKGNSILKALRNTYGARAINQIGKQKKKKKRNSEELKQFTCDVCANDELGDLGIVDLLHSPAPMQCGKDFTDSLNSDFIPASPASGRPYATPIPHATCGSLEHLFCNRFFPTTTVPRAGYIHGVPDSTTWRRCMRLGSKAPWTAQGSIERQLPQRAPGVACPAEFMKRLQDGINANGGLLKRATMPASDGKFVYAMCDTDHHKWCDKSYADTKVWARCMQIGQETNDVFTVLSLPWAEYTKPGQYSRLLPPPDPKCPAEFTAKLQQAIASGAGTSKTPFASCNTEEHRWCDANYPSTKDYELTAADGKTKLTWPGINVWGRCMLYESLGANKPWTLAGKSARYLPDSMAAKVGVGDIKGAVSDLQDAVNYELARLVPGFAEFLKCKNSADNVEDKAVCFLMWVLQLISELLNFTAVKIALAIVAQNFVQAILEGVKWVIGKITAQNADARALFDVVTSSGDAFRMLYEKPLEAVRTEGFYLIIGANLQTHGTDRMKLLGRFIGEHAKSIVKVAKYDIGALAEAIKTKYQALISGMRKLDPSVLADIDITNAIVASAVGIFKAAVKVLDIIPLVGKLIAKPFELLIQAFQNMTISAAAIKKWAEDTAKALEKVAGKGADVIANAASTITNETVKMLEKALEESKYIAKAAADKAAAAYQKGYDAARKEIQDASAKDVAKGAAAGVVVGASVVVGAGQPSSSSTVVETQAKAQPQADQPAAKTNKVVAGAGLLAAAAGALLLLR